MNKFYLLLLFITIVSCKSNRLKQDNVEKAIKEFVSNNSVNVTWQVNPFDANSISSIEPISQFTENEANTIVHFKFKDSWTKENLVLKFNFKKDLDNKWFLTSVVEVSGVGSSAMQSLLEKWENTSLLTQ